MTMTALPVGLELQVRAPLVARTPVARTLGVKTLGVKTQAVRMLVAKTLVARMPVARAAQRDSPGQQMPAPWAAQMLRLLLMLLPRWRAINLQGRSPSPQKTVSRSRQTGIPPLKPALLPWRCST